jgi:hypothetical protein
MVVLVPTGVQALLVVAVVLVEAMLLYVGYGYLEAQFAPKLLETIQGI